MVPQDSCNLSVGLLALDDLLEAVSGAGAAAGAGLTGRGGSGLWLGGGSDTGAGGDVSCGSGAVGDVSGSVVSIGGVCGIGGGCTIGGGCAIGVGSGGLDGVSLSFVCFLTHRLECIY